jgi:hypothetical protein
VDKLAGIEIALYVRMDSQGLKSDTEQSTNPRCPMPEVCEEDGCAGHCADIECCIESTLRHLTCSQERLGREFEEVLFGNLWELYAR